MSMKLYFLFFFSFHPLYFLFFFSFHPNVNDNVDIAIRIACNEPIPMKCECQCWHSHYDTLQLHAMSNWDEKLTWISWGTDFFCVSALQLRSWAAESELLDEPQLAARFPWAYGTLQRDSNLWNRILVLDPAVSVHMNWSSWLMELAPSAMLVRIQRSQDRKTG